MEFVRRKVKVSVSAFVDNFNKCSGPDGFESRFYQHFSPLCANKFIKNVVRGYQQVRFLRLLS